MTHQSGKNAEQSSEFSAPAAQYLTKTQRRRRQRQNQKRRVAQSLAEPHGCAAHSVDVKVALEDEAKKKRALNKSERRRKRRIRARKALRNTTTPSIGALEETGREVPMAVSQSNSLVDAPLEKGPLLGIDKQLLTPKTASTAEVESKIESKVEQESERSQWAVLINEQFSFKEEPDFQVVHKESAASGNEAKYPQYQAASWAADAQINGTSYLQWDHCAYDGQYMNMDKCNAYYMQTNSYTQCMLNNNNNSYDTYYVSQQHQQQQQPQNQEEQQQQFYPQNAGAQYSKRCCYVQCPDFDHTVHQIQEHILECYNQLA